MRNSSQAFATPKPVQRKRAAAKPCFDPDRRQHILQAALQEFSKRGFHRTTIRDIARAAELAEGTIYNHFENKSALITTLIAQLQAQGQQVADLNNFASVPIAQFLPNHFGLMLSQNAKGNVNVLGVLLAELLTDSDLREAHAGQLLNPVFEIGDKALKMWTKQGQLRKTRSELTVRLIGAMLLGIQVQHMLGDDVIKKRWKELPVAMSALILNGIQSDTQKFKKEIS